VGLEADQILKIEADRQVEVIVRKLSMTHSMMKMMEKMM